jgi:uncharacterized protein (UPF0335 family)
MTEPLDPFSDSARIQRLEVELKKQSEQISEVLRNFMELVPLISSGESAITFELEELRQIVGGENVYSERTLLNRVERLEDWRSGRTAEDD